MMQQEYTVEEFCQQYRHLTGAQKSVTPDYIRRCCSKYNAPDGYKFRLPKGWTARKAANGRWIIKKKISTTTSNKLPAKVEPEELLTDSQMLSRLTSVLTEQRHLEQLVPRLPAPLLKQLTECYHRATITNTTYKIKLTFAADGSYQIDLFQPNKLLLEVNDIRLLFKIIWMDMCLTDDSTETILASLKEIAQKSPHLANIRLYCLGCGKQRNRVTGFYCPKSLCGQNLARFCKKHSSRSTEHIVSAIDARLKKLKI